MCRDGCPVNHLLHACFRYRIDSRMQKCREAIMFSIDELAAVPLFSALEDKELDYLAGNVEDIRLVPGEYVAHEGEGRFLAVVVEGKTELTKLVNDVEQVIGVRLPGELGGEIPMTLGTPLPASM